MSNKYQDPQKSTTFFKNLMTHYICYLPHQPDWVVTSCRPPFDWPQHGEIEFKNYSTRYRPGLDLVLTDISFTVRPGEKVGSCWTR